MPRRPAEWTQADIARALRAAEQAGPDWAVRLVRGQGIVIVRTREEERVPVIAPEPEANDEKWEDWGA